MLKISAAAREMKDRVKGREGGGKEKEEVRKTQRDKERTWEGGRTGLRRECTSTVHSFRAIRHRTRSGFHKNGNR